MNNVVNIIKESDNQNMYKVVKGVIKYPCCPNEKVVVIEGTSGMVSSICPNCHRYVLFDYDRMMAVPIKAIRGATKILRKAPESPSR